MSLKIVKLEVYEVRIPFRFTFKHALAERSMAHNLLIAAHTNTGHVGWGEVLPRDYLTGETISSAWTDIRTRWWPAVRELEFSEHENPVKRLKPIYLEADRARKTQSYGGVDIAVVDAWARAAGVPGRSLFGQKPPKRQYFTAPVGGGGPNSVKWISRIGKWVGYRDFKLKTGRPDDRVRVAKAREIIGPALDLRVDANAAFAVDQALAQSPMLREFGVSSVEQPIPAGDFAGLAKIQREGGIPVMADESLCTLADANVLISEKSAALWNVRLAKVGGFTGFLEQLALARVHGIGVHHGVLVGESPVLAAAARACAGLAEYKHVEYGYPWLLLKTNTFSGWPGGNWGVGWPLGNRPGLGVEPYRASLNEVTVHNAVFT